MKWLLLTVLVFLIIAAETGVAQLFNPQVFFPSTTSPPPPVAGAIAPGNLFVSGNMMLANSGNKLIVQPPLPIVIVSFPSAAYPIGVP